MSYNPPSIAPYNYNANPPPDDGSRTPNNRVSWARIRTTLTDPLRTWMDAINNEIARAFGEVAFQYVPTGATFHMAYSGLPPGWVPFNVELSGADFARLGAVLGGVWTYQAVATGNFLTPPGNRYIRDVGSSPVGTLLADQNKAHSHNVTDPGHAHALPTQWTAGSKDVEGSLLSTIPLTPTSGNTVTGTTGISIQVDGGSETRPYSAVMFGVVKA